MTIKHFCILISGNNTNCLYCLAERGRPPAWRRLTLMVGNYTTSLVWTVKTELSVGSEVIILICPTRITFNYPLTQVGQHAAQLRSADFSLCYREPRGIIVLGRPSITDYTSDSRLSLLFTFLIRQWWGGSKKEAADSGGVPCIDGLALFGLFSPGVSVQQASQDCQELSPAFTETFQTPPKLCGDGVGLFTHWLHWWRLLHCHGLQLCLMGRK